MRRPRFPLDFSRAVPENGRAGRWECPADAVMKAVIVGAGNVGRNLARKLCEEDYGVSVVDRAPAPLAEIGEQLDLLTVQGHGADPALLGKAGVEGADLLVAVTNQDEINILACACARAAGVRHRVARITNNAWFSGKLGLHLSDLGVEFAINPIRECAREIAALLRLPGALEIADLFDGRAQAVGLRVSTNSPLIRAPLKNYPDPEFLSRIRFIALRQGTEIVTPTGETHAQIGDDIYLAGRAEHIPAYADVMAPDRPRLERVIVSGGGPLGLAIAQRLEETELETVLLESDQALAESCSGRLRRTLVIRSGGVYADALKEAGVNASTAFVATTDDDENNIISCLVAQKHGASLTIAQVNQPEYVPIIDGLSLLDRTVSTHLSVVNAVLRFVRGRNVRATTQLQTLPGELIEVVLREGMPWVGRRIRDLRIPKGSIIASLERGGEIVVPTGDLELLAGDRLVLYALPRAVGRLAGLFQS